MITGVTETKSTRIGTHGTQNQKRQNYINQNTRKSYKDRHPINGIETYHDKVYETQIAQDQHTVVIKAYIGEGKVIVRDNIPDTQRYFKDILNHNKDKNQPVYSVIG